MERDDERQSGRRRVRFRDLSTYIEETSAYSKYDEVKEGKEPAGQDVKVDVGSPSRQTEYPTLPPKIEPGAGKDMERPRKEGDGKGAVVYFGGEGSKLEKAEMQWKQKGNAESRGARGYDPGNTKDSLWQGGGSTRVPEGLRRGAGGGGGGKEGGGSGGGAGGDDGGGDKGKGKGVEKDATKDRPSSSKEPAFDELPSMANLELRGILRNEERSGVLAAIQSHGQDSPEAAVAIEEAAFGWYDYGIYDEATRLQVQSLEITESIYGSEHRKTIRAVDILAKFWRTQLRYEEAEQLLLRIIKWSRRNPGGSHRKPRHSNTLGRAILHLASVYSKLGRYEEAKDLRVELLELRKQVLEHDDPAVIEAMSLLAEGYYEVREYGASERLYRDLLEWSRNALGPKHKTTVDAMAGLARALASLGKDEEACQLQHEVEANEDQMDILARMASEYSQRGLYEESLRLTLQVLDLQIWTLGPEHEAASSTLKSVFSLYAKLERTKEVEELLKQVVERSIKVVGECDKLTVILLSKRASILNGLGRNTEAEMLWNQVLCLVTEIWGEDAEQTVDARTNLAYTWTKLRRYDEALRLQNQVVERNKRLLGGKKPATIDSLTTLGVYVAEQLNSREPSVASLISGTSAMTVKS